jgi:5,10-methenyltetrahydromethanopterin hydrogenase
MLRDNSFDYSRFFRNISRRNVVIDIYHYLVVAMRFGCVFRNYGRAMLEQIRQVARPGSADARCKNYHCLFLIYGSLRKMHCMHTAMVMSCLKYRVPQGLWHNNTNASAIFGRIRKT